MRFSALALGLTASALAALTSVAGSGCPSIVTVDARREPGDDTYDPYDPNDPGHVVAPPLQCTERAVGPSPMHRLTHAEYDAALEDLLGDTSQRARSFAPDSRVGLFDTTVSSQTVPVLLAEQYVDAAMRAAVDADVEALAGCDVDDGACRRDFIESFGRLAYRRPLTSAEVDGLVGLANEAGQGDDGVRAVIAALLASPHFLFRPESGVPDDELPNGQRVDPFALAARLASLLWGSVPDDELLDAAENGALETREQVEAQARRMLDPSDPRARRATKDFYAQWLGLEQIDHAAKDRDVFPAWDDDMPAHMRTETEMFVEDVLWNGDAKLSTLLTAPYTFANGPLAALYGVEGPGSADEFARVELDPDVRSGILTHASFLAGYAALDETSPVKRGRYVRARLLCQDLPDPPPGIPPLASPQEGTTMRERLAQHTSAAGCIDCHQMIDSIGFGLESYDGIGRHRTTVDGAPVDDDGWFDFTRDLNGLFAGGREMGQRMAASTQVSDCVPLQWMRYVLGRRETGADTCSLTDLNDRFRASGGDLRELLIAITQTDAFLAYEPDEPVPSSVP